MQKLIIPRVLIYPTLSQDEMNLLIEEKGILQKINHVNWEEYPYSPDVHFRILHTGNEIWLKFFVQEKHIRAIETQTNGPVHKDSTVEFFISLDGSNYYNFEFNCIGTRHLAYGSGRGNRTRISPEIAEKIRIKSTLGEKPFEEKSGDFNWEMTIQIPFECFAFDALKSVNGKEATANFYKCGDDTSEPHFISWNPIETATPDYHRPEFFGEIIFE